MSGISLVAWWGAVLSTVVLVWDIYKWANKGPKVKILTICGVSYPNGRVVGTRQTEHGTETELASYCHIEISNAGDSATTVISIEGSHNHKKSEPQMSFSGPVFTSLSDKRFPLVLGPGEMWSGRVEMQDLEQLASRGRPYIELRASHRLKTYRAYPVLARPKAATRWAAFHKLFRKAVAQ